MADILYNILEHFSITKCLLCITTNNVGNNSTVQKDLEELLNILDINNDWSSEFTKILCLAHMIQLVIKAILGAFDIKPAEGEHFDNNINDRSVNNIITKI